MVWATLLLPAGLAFVGALVGALLARKGAREVDRWRRREESLRLLRWGVELAIDGEPSCQRAGVLALGALLDSPLLDRQDVALAESICAGVAGNEDMYDEREADASTREKGP